MPEILVPTALTLKKHGLDEHAWRVILDRQRGVCGACGTLPPSLRLNLDHEHVRGYAKMSDENKRKYHRGLLCMMCNRYRLARGATFQNLQGAANYLRAYENRRIDESIRAAMEKLNAQALEA